MVNKCKLLTLSSFQLCHQNQIITLAVHKERKRIYWFNQNSKQLYITRNNYILYQYYILIYSRLEAQENESDLSNSRLVLVSRLIGLESKVNPMSWKPSAEANVCVWNKETVF